jgi:hypothetical protein
MHVIVRTNSIYATTDEVCTYAIEALRYPARVMNPTTWHGAAIPPFIERATIESYNVGTCSLNDTVSLQLIDEFAVQLNV